MRDFLSICSEIVLKWMQQDHADEKLTVIGPGKGLVRSSIKQLHEPMLTKICATKWHHWATMI